MITGTRHKFRTLLIESRFNCICYIAMGMPRMFSCNISISISTEKS